LKTFHSARPLSAGDIGAQEATSKWAGPVRVNTSPNSEDPVIMLSYPKPDAPGLDRDMSRNTPDFQCSRRGTGLTFFDAWPQDPQIETRALVPRIGPQEHHEQPLDAAVRPGCQDLCLGVLENTLLIEDPPSGFRKGITHRQRDAQRNRSPCHRLVSADKSQRYAMSPIQALLEVGTVVLFHHNTVDLRPCLVSLGPSAARDGTFNESAPHTPVQMNVDSPTSAIASSLKGLRKGTLHSGKGGYHCEEQRSWLTLAFNSPRTHRSARLGVWCVGGERELDIQEPLRSGQIGMAVCQGRPDT